MPTLTTRVRVIGGSALVAFIAAFLPWWSFRLPSLTLNVDGWSAGFGGVGGTMLLTVAGVYLILRRLEYAVWAPPFGDARLAAALAGAGLLLVIIRWATLPSLLGISADARYGIWIALAAGVVETVAVIFEARGHPVTTE